MPPRAKKAVPAVMGEVVEGAPADKPWAAVELNGRRIEFNQPNPAQMIVMRRLSRQMDGAKTQGQQFFIIAQFLDAVSALMVNPADREWADTEVLEGRADLPEMTPLLVAAISGQDALDRWYENRKNPAPPRRVRRARS